MLALQKVHDGEGLALRDVPAPPPPGPGELAIRIAATGICGTDLGIETWGAGYAAMMTKALPVTLGHETVGRVSALGDGVEGFAMGDAVVVNPAIACGHCAACLAGDHDPHAPRRRRDRESPVRTARDGRERSTSLTAVSAPVPPRGDDRK